MLVSFFWESGLHFLIQPKRRPQLSLGSTPETRVGASRREGEAAAPGTRSHCKGEPVAFGAMPSEAARPHHLGPNGIDCPSLTDCAGTRERMKRMSPGTGGREGGGDRRCRPLRSSGSPGGCRGMRLGRPATLRRPRAARSAWEGPPAPDVPSGGREGAHSTRARPEAATPTAPPQRPGLPAPVRRAPCHRPQGGREGRGEEAAAAEPPGRAARGRRTARGTRVGPRDRSPGRPSRRPPARTPASARLQRSRPPPGARSSPHLRAGARCRPRHKSVPLTRRARGEGRRIRSPAHHPRLPPRRPGARSGCSLASRRTTEQPSCAPSPRSSTPLYLLRSLAP
uniref:Basic salivary proline-rich protein 1-like n=1 Tax=Castor canadensis TaxID=51338 RepID=A0A8B7UFD7_CASCN|nr:basic salivary proline-rich protein 1-like [Castor canadensis]